MVTLSIIKADTGGWVGHSSVHPESDSGSTGGAGPPVRRVLREPARTRSRLRGARVRRAPNEPVICFLADKTEPGAWNLPLYKMFADPFNTAGLVIDKNMHGGFVFEVYDLFEDKRLEFSCPEDIYELLMYIGAPARYVVHGDLAHARHPRSGHEHPASLPHRREVLRQGRPSDDRALPVGSSRRGQSPRAVHSGPQRGRLHARLTPRAPDAGRGQGRDTQPVRRPASGRRPRVPGPRRPAGHGAPPARRPLVRPGPCHPTQSWTTCADTVPASHTGCPWKTWSTPRCASSRPSWPTAGPRSVFRSTDWSGRPGPRPVRQCGCLPGRGSACPGDRRSHREHEARSATRNADRWP